MRETPCSFEWIEREKVFKGRLPDGPDRNETKMKHTHTQRERERERNTTHVTTFYIVKKLKKEVTSQSNRRQRGPWPDKTMQ